MSVKFALAVGALVACDTFGLAGAQLRVAEQIKGPECKPFYALIFVSTGNTVPGRYDQRLLRDY